MKVNRSMPEATVIPTLAYPDVAEAVAWLCDTFGFAERLRIGDHRAQLHVGAGADAGNVVVTAYGPPTGDEARPTSATHSVMVRVSDVNRHHEHARSRGARIVQEPADFPYGERQYTVEDLGGHQWTFSETIADVDPTTWGGVLR